MRRFLYGLLVSGLFLTAGGASVQAEEQRLYLWKNQREAHQVEIDARAEQYKTRGQAYVDHMYATQGEEEMPEPEMDIHSDPGLGAADQVEPEEVNLQDVQKILSAEDSAQ